MDIRILASGSAGNCYHVTDGTTPLLLEAGIGYRHIQTALNFNTRQLHGCLVTHEHKDHSRAIPQLLRSRIPLYMTKGTWEAMNLDLTPPHIIKAGSPFSVDTWSILPFEAHHDAAEPVGFLMASTTGEKLLYATDTSFIGHRFQGVTHLMIEANYCEKILKENIAAGQVSPTLANRLYDTHMNIRRVKDFLTTGNWNSLQEIHLLHLSDRNADAASFKQQVQSLTGLPVYVAGMVDPPEEAIYG